MNQSNNYYDQDYFTWQKNLGVFGGLADLFKFEPFVKTSDTVLDFGCGGGYLLSNLRCTRRIGIEINPIAHEEAKQRVEVFKSVAEVPCYVDCIISNHALEHVDDPLSELRGLFKLLKHDGLCVFVTPYEDKAQAWNPSDINKHLYTWAPLNLGNLFTRAGFSVIECGIIEHTWPDDFAEFAAKHGWEAFHKRCAEFAKQTNTKQVRVIAKKL